MATDDEQLEAQYSVNYPEILLASTQELYELEGSETPPEEF